MMILDDDFWYSHEYFDYYNNFQINYISIVLSVSFILFKHVSESLMLPLNTLYIFLLNLSNIRIQEFKKGVNLQTTNLQYLREYAGYAN